MDARRSLTLLGSVLTVSACITTGCRNYYEDDYLSLVDQTSTTSSGTPAGCVPSKDPKHAVADTCGVFVSVAGDDMSPGTQAAPVGTLGHALTLAKGRPIYACTGMTPFHEAITVPAGTAIYGGLDCISWKYVGVMSKTTIAADAGQIPITLATGSGAELHDLHVLAASAMDAGGSSIAVVADHATAEIDACMLEAGDGKDGDPGKGYTSAAMVGASGSAGTDACKMDMVFGGAAVASMCGSTPDSISGGGGTGGLLSGGDGSDGQPGATTNGGKGEGAMVCAPGTKGDDGSPGTAGAGATDLGTLNASGYAGAAGKDGGPGAVGQGGGGGGGAKGGTGANQCKAGMAGGASGGSGGSGGCGGAGGRAGQPGGASIALVSLDATLTFTNVTMKNGTGGNGGDGGPAQNGGGGGMPGAGGKASGLALNPGCDGGPGGFGGKGGQGGGGRGGHAIGVGYTGKAPTTSGVTFTKGTPGVGGHGDNGNGNQGDGAMGVGADTQVFP